MPAIPMKDAAERYSPEIAEAFQPTETERPATKKSLAVLEVRAERKPIQIVATTVMSEKVKIHGSTPSRKARGIMGSAFHGIDLVLLQRDGALDEFPRDDPDEGEEQHAENKPAQRETGHPGGHERRGEIVEQRQTKQRDQKRGGTGHGKLKLTAHERVQNLLAMHSVRTGRDGRHRIESYKPPPNRASPM